MATNRPRRSPAMRAPLPVATTPRERLLSHLRRAREEAVAIVVDGTDLWEVIPAIDEAIREAKNALSE